MVIKVIKDRGKVKGKKFNRQEEVSIVLRLNNWQSAKDKKQM